MSSTPAHVDELVELSEMDLEHMTSGKGQGHVSGSIEGVITPPVMEGPPAFLAESRCYPPILRWLASRGRVGPGEDKPITRYVQP
jgi:hypothetical protein